MADERNNLTPVNEWTDVTQIEQNDYVLGGAGQVSNLQAQALLNRTFFLKNLIDNLITQIEIKDQAQDDAIDSKVAIADIVNNTSTTTEGKVLDGRVGKTLKDLIDTNYNTLDTAIGLRILKSDIVTNYTTNSTTKVVSASVAYQLKALIDGKQPAGSYVLTSNVVNNTTTTASGKVLDGRVGKTLADLINSNVTTLNNAISQKIAKTDISTSYVNSATKVPSASLIYSLKALVDSKQPAGSYVLTSNVVNNTTTTASGKVLDGRVGKTLADTISSNYTTLNTNKVNKTDIVDNLTTNDATKVLSAKQGKVLNDKLISSVPIGTVLPYFGADSNLPATFQKCAGQTLTKASYSELFNAFLSAGMVSSSATSFVVPDLRKRYLKGSIRNDSAGYIGRFLNEKLPNITGALGVSQLMWNDQNLIDYGGAIRFIGGDGSGIMADGGSPGIQLRKATFRASDSNSIYGVGSQTGDGGQNVIPFSCIVNWIIRVK